MSNVASQSFRFLFCPYYKVERTTCTLQGWNESHLPFDWSWNKQVLGKSGCYKTYCQGFPSGSVVKNPPASAGDMSLIPGSGSSHMPWSNQAREPQLLSLCSRAQEPQLPSPCVANSWARVPSSPRPATREATAVRGVHTTVRRGPRSLQLEKSAHSHEYPAQPKINDKYINTKHKTYSQVSLVVLKSLWNTWNRALKYIQPLFRVYSFYIYAHPPSKHTCAPHRCRKSARKRDLRMPGLDGCCAGLRASLPGGFPKPFRCHREESGNPGSLYSDRQNPGLGARALSLVLLNKHKYCLTRAFLLPAMCNSLYAIAQQDPWEQEGRLPPPAAGDIPRPGHRGALWPHVFSKII